MSKLRERVKSVFETDEELYRWVDARLGVSVDRRLAEVSTNVGEFESALFDLLDYASSEGAIPQEVIAIMCAEYPEGPYREYFEDIVRINEKNKARR